MHILVLIKQVPETDKVKMDPETGTMIRTGQETIINPLDLYAIEEALTLKEMAIKEADPTRAKATAEMELPRVTVLTMGPQDADRALREALSMGCDDAILLTDRGFAGSDTWATARVLAAAIEKVGDCDLILAGERATDGDTGQVPCEVAAQLGLPVVTYVSKLSVERPVQNVVERPVQNVVERPVQNAGAGVHLLVHRLTEEGYQVLRATTPCVVSVVKEIASPRLPTLRGKKASRNAAIVRWGMADLGLEAGTVGLTGSPTRVTKVFYPKISRNGQRIVANDDSSIDLAVKRTLEILDTNGLLQASYAQTENAVGTVEALNSLGIEAIEATEGIEVLDGQSSQRSPRRDRPEFWVLAEFRSGGTGSESSDGKSSDRNSRFEDVDTGGTQVLDTVSLELLARGRKLADERGANLVAVAPTRKLAMQDARRLVAYGADEVIAVEGEGFEHFVCEPWARTLCSLIESRKPEVVLGAATSTGRTLLPYLAALVGTGLTADCTELAIEPDTGLLLQTRPAIGGNIMATIKTAHHRPQMATIRPHSVKPLEPDFSRRGGMTRVSNQQDEPKSGQAKGLEFLGLERNVGDFENLEGMRLVISGGRGLKKAENFQLIRDFVAALACGVDSASSVGIGASREAVDRGWLSYPHQVGLSGKTISPDVYIAVGISGAVQHLAGIRTAKTIVSINSDPEAPIHSIADLAIVGDLFEIVPRLTAALYRHSNAGTKNAAGRVE